MRDGILKPAEDEASLKRLVFSHVALDQPASIPMKLEPASQSCFSHLTGTTALEEVQETSSAWIHGVDLLPMPFMQRSSDPDATGHDIRTAEGARGGRQDSGPEVPCRDGDQSCLKVCRKV